MNLHYLRYRRLNSEALAGISACKIMNLFRVEKKQIKNTIMFINQLLIRSDHYNISRFFFDIISKIYFEYIYKRNSHQRFQACD